MYTLQFAYLLNKLKNNGHFNVSVGQEGLQQAQLMYAVVLTYILLKELGCYVCYLVVVVCVRVCGGSFSFFLLTSIANIDGLKNKKIRVCFFSPWANILLVHYFSYFSLISNAENVFTRSGIFSGDLKLEACRSLDSSEFFIRNRTERLILS